MNKRSCPNESFPYRVDSQIDYVMRQLHSKLCFDSTIFMRELRCVPYSNKNLTLKIYYTQGQLFLVMKGVLVRVDPLHVCYSAK